MAEECGTHCKMYPGADGDMDHMLLVAVLKVKLTTKRKNQREGLDLDALTGHKKMEYACAVANRFDCLSEESLSVNEKWERLKEVLKDTAEEIGGKKKAVKRNRWISAKTVQLAAEKREARLKDQVRHKVLKTAVQRSAKEDRNKFVNAFVDS